MSGPSHKQCHHWLSYTVTQISIKPKIPCRLRIWQKSWKASFIDSCVQIYRSKILLCTYGAYLVQGLSLGSILSVGNIVSVLVYLFRMRCIVKSILTRPCSRRCTRCRFVCMLASSHFCTQTATAYTATDGGVR